MTNKDNNILEYGLIENFQLAFTTFTYLNATLDIYFEYI